MALLSNLSRRLQRSLILNVGLLWVILWGESGRCVYAWKTALKRVRMELRTTLGARCSPGKSKLSESGVSSLIWKETGRAVIDTRRSSDSVKLRLEEEHNERHGGYPPEQEVR